MKVNFKVIKMDDNDFRMFEENDSLGELLPLLKRFFPNLPKGFKYTSGLMSNLMVDLRFWSDNISKLVSTNSENGTSSIFWIEEKDGELLLSNQLGE